LSAEETSESAARKDGRARIREVLNDDVIASIPIEVGRGDVVWVSARIAKDQVSQPAAAVEQKDVDERARAARFGKDDVLVPIAIEGGCGDPLERARAGRERRADRERPVAVPKVDRDAPTGLTGTGGLTLSGDGNVRMSVGVEVGNRDVHVSYSRVQ